MPRKRRMYPETPAFNDEDDSRPHSYPKRLRNTINFSSRSKHDEGFTQKKCLNWFRQYSTLEDNNLIGPEGIEQFCADLDVEPENIVMLVIAWKLNAKSMGFFTAQEWCDGFTELQIDNTLKLRDKLEYLKSMLHDNILFKSIYRYAYDFAREKDQRSMDIDTAKGMLHLLLSKQWKLYPEFNNFLEQSKYKVINKDQWCNILEFSRSITNDLANYDVDGAWPVMLDEFVEWLKDNGKV